jgi:DNA-binding response OmpR family regulator
LVDDELDITLTLKIALEASGFFQVEAFYDSALDLSRFKAGVYDLALLDIRMPEMNGFELCRKLREIDNKLKICFLTATDPDLYRGTDLDLINELGIGCFVSKPIDNEGLVSKLKAMLSQT